MSNYTEGGLSFCAVFASLILSYTTQTSVKCELHSVCSAEPAAVQESISGAWF